MEAPCPVLCIRTLAGEELRLDAEELEQVVNVHGPYVYGLKQHLRSKLGRSVFQQQLTRLSGRPLMNGENVRDLPAELQLVLSPLRQGCAKILLQDCEQDRDAFFRWVLQGLQDPDEADERGCLAVVTVAFYDLPQHLDLLIDALADLNKEDFHGCTALCVAAARENLPIAHRLLSARADVNAMGRGNSIGFPSSIRATPLWHAYGKRIPIIRLLAEADADLNWAVSERHLPSGRRDLAGTTPLLLASMGSYEETARYLLDVGADYSKADVSGRSPALAAAEAGNAYVIHCLAIARADLEQSDAWGGTPLGAASARGFVRTVSTLVLARANVHAPDSWGRRPLAMAAASGCRQTLSALLQANADVDSPDGWGTTPLLTAARCGHLRAVATLLRARAHVDRADNWGRTPLSAAAASDHAGVVFSLVLAGADKDKADHSGRTPLLAACESAGLRAVLALVSCGADVGRADCRGRTAWEVLADRDDMEDFEGLFATRRPQLRMRRYASPSDSDSDFWDYDI